VVAAAQERRIAVLMCACEATFVCSRCRERAPFDRFVDEQVRRPWIDADEFEEMAREGLRHGGRGEVDAD
jgi:hypothetical protein